MQDGLESPNKAHTPNQDYVYHTPGPPHIWVPPIDEDARELRIHESASHDHGSTGFANVDFLKAINYTNFERPPYYYDWNHDHRWKAQAILPFLYLGPTCVLRDGPFLQQRGITMILRIRLVMASGSRSLDVAVANPAIEIHTIDVEGLQDLIAAFPRGINMINTHMSRLFNTWQQAPTNSPHRSVLVCCETGNDRSPCMIAAYLMAMYGMGFIRAAQIVQTRRFSANLGGDPMTMLQTYQSILEARRSVTLNTVAQSQASRNAETDQDLGRGNKRSVDDFYDENFDMDMTDMAEPQQEFGKREGRAPFEDRGGL